MRRARSAVRAPRRALRLDVEILEDRLPVSENFGTLLAVSALAGGADTMLESPRVREWAARRVEAAESTAGMASLVAPNGLTLTEHLPLVEAGAHSAETAARLATTIDTFFADLGNDLDTNSEQPAFSSSASPADGGHGSDSGPQSPSVGAGTIFSAPIPAYAASGAASGQSASYLASAGMPFPATPVAADAQLTQTLRSSPSAPLFPKNSGNSTTQTPVQLSSGPVIRGVQPSPQGGGIQPLVRPLVATAGGDGVVPEFECGCSSRAIRAASSAPCLADRRSTYLTGRASTTSL